MTFHRDTKSKLSLFFWFLQVILLLGSLVFLIWTCLTPKDPLFTITSVHVSPLPSRNSTFINISELSPNTSIILKLEILNPNRGLGIFHDEAYLSLHVSDSFVGYKRLHGFYQGFSENVTWVVSVKPGKIFWHGRMVTTSVMDVRVSLKTAVKFKYKIFRTETKHYKIEIEAYVPIGLDGRQLENLNIKLQPSYKAKLTRKEN